MIRSTDLEQQYGIHILKKVRVRDVFKIYTRSHGVLCLKSYDITEAEMRFITQVFTHLLQKDFGYGPKVLLTVNHSYWVRRDGVYYMLTNWVIGEQPQFKRKEHLQKGIRLLTKFHSISDGFNAPFIPEERIRYNTLKDRTTSDCNLLEKYPKMKHAWMMCHEALAELDNTMVVNAIEQEHSAMAFVHGDYNYPNLVLDSTRTMHMIDFDNTSLYVRMEDFAHILHRNGSWQGKRMLRWIEYYDKYRPLSKEDMNLLHTLLLVPYPIIRALKQRRRYKKVQIIVPSVQRIKEYRNELKQLL